MMLESQKQPQAYENSLVYELISDSSLPALDKPSPIMESTSLQQQQLPAYKYWNPATIDDMNYGGSHVSAKVELIGEFSNQAIRIMTLILRLFS